MPPDGRSIQAGIHRSRFARSPLNSKRLWIWFLIALGFACFYDLGLIAPNAFAAEEQTAAHPAGEASDTDETKHSSHGDGVRHRNPVTPVLLAIVLILFLAKTGGDLFERLGMPAVLGELTVGIILGNFTLLTGSEILEQYFNIQYIPESLPDPHPDNPTQLFYNTATIVKILAGIGVILLLFEVGLESTVHEMLSVGLSSLLVAVLGVAAPMALGWLVGWWLIPDQGWEVHAFIGATLCATSVGITARVLKDLGRSRQREAQIILGAAVIDDVLGLVILAVISGVISQEAENFHFLGLLVIVVKAFGFLAGAVLLGTLIFTRPLFKAASFLRGHGMLVAVALVICFGFSWLAALVGLEPIVGAFAAGLILERTHYRELGERENHNLEEALAPLSALLVPIFFVQMGTQVDLESFSDKSVWGLAAAMTVMAIIGKQVCAFGVREKGLNSLAVGLGMIPRGEVGLIFADVGRNLKTVDGCDVIDDKTFSAIVVMVMITTMVTPPLLKWSLSRGASNLDDTSTDETEPASTEM